MKSSRHFFIFATLLLPVVCMEAAVLPQPWDSDCVPESWTRMDVTWKGSWDETLAANYDDKSWKAAVEQDVELRGASDQIVRLRHIALLQALIAHFPADKDKHARAYQAIADEYAKLDDRTRAIQWLRKATEDFAGRKDLLVAAYTNILKFSCPFDSIPDTIAWTDFAANGILTLEKEGFITRDSAAAALARRHSCMVLSHFRRFDDVRSFLDRFKAAEGNEKWWLIESASLMENSGHLLKAAELYDKAGDTSRAAALRERAGTTSEELVMRPPAELDMRWNVLARRAAPATGPALEDPGFLQEVLRLSAETGALQVRSPSHRVTFWIAADELLHGFSPADLVPLRRLQEKRATAIAGELALANDINKVMAAYRRYPWAACMNKVLVEFGEITLVAGRNNWAIRAFRDVLSHADDPQVLAQAHAGLWLALAQEPASASALDEAMAAVKDDASLPWRGTNVPASELKKLIRGQAPAGNTVRSDLAKLPRRKITLPTNLAADTPASHSDFLSTQGIGPWSIRRIEPADDSLFIMAPRHLACYRGNTEKPLWVHDEQRPLVEQSESFIPLEGRAGRAGPPAPWRPAIVGSRWSKAVTDRRGATADRATSLSAVYTLTSERIGDAVTWSVVALDARSGRPLWNTRESTEWSDLVIMTQPSASDGNVYLVACGPPANRFRPLYIICASGNNGSIVRKLQVGFAPSEGSALELAMAGSAITVHEGSLYVSTDLGMVVRCDARDGSIEWVRSYRSVMSGNIADAQFKREGTSPMLDGNRIILAPRDHSGVMALDSSNGRLIWEALLVPAEQVVGICGNALIVRSAGSLTALDPGSGKELWKRTLSGMTVVNAVVSGNDILVATGDKLIRLEVATGAGVDELKIDKPAGSETLILPDGSLVELSAEPTSSLAEKQPEAPGPLRLPLAETWSLPSSHPLLVLPSREWGPADKFGVLSGRSLYCIRSKPACALAWERLLSDRPDSAGFHGNLMITVNGGDLTALDSETGSTRWTAVLPFTADVTGGDEYTIFAAELSGNAKVAAIDAASGRLLWTRWFGREVRFAGKKLNWAAIQKTGDRSTVELYFSEAFLGRQGWRPAVVTVDPPSGLVKDVRSFPPDEPKWPAFIAFGDDIRTYTHERPLVGWTSRGPMTWDAATCVGEDSKARFLLRGRGTDVVQGLRPVMNVIPDEQYWISVSLNTTGTGAYIRRLGMLEYFDNTSTNWLSFEVPRSDPARISYNIFDFREIGSNVMSVAGMAPSSRHLAIGGEYRRDALQSADGKGSVTLVCFTQEAQLGHYRRGIPEAGSSPAATLLDGEVKQHYRGSSIKMSGLSTLGWSRFDVFFYGFIGTATINGIEKTCRGYDHNNKLHRTTFLAGTNYVKFAGLSGDSFTMTFTETGFSGIQVVDASPSVARETAGCIGIRWTGGGAVLRATDKVGAEVASTNWYNIDKYNVLSGGPEAMKSGLPGVCVDLFDRASGRRIDVQTLPGTAPRPAAPGYSPQAHIYDDMLILTDSQTARVFRSGAKPRTD